MAANEPPEQGVERWVLSIDPHVADRLKKFLDPQSVMTGVLQVIGNLAREANTQADLGEHLMRGLNEKVPQVELGKILEQDLEATRQAGVSKPRVAALLNELPLKPADSQRLELALSSIELDRNLEIKLDSSRGIDRSI